MVLYELAEWVEETLSFGDEGDGGRFASGDDKGVTFLQIKVGADFDGMERRGSQVSESVEVVDVFYEGALQCLLC